jgi:hypothetical protein
MSSILAGGGTVDLLIRWSIVAVPVVGYGLLHWHARPAGRPAGRHHASRHQSDRQRARR